MCTVKRPLTGAIAIPAKGGIDDVLGIEGGLDEHFFVEGSSFTFHGELIQYTSWYR